MLDEQINYENKSFSKHSKLGALQKV